jgi:hypothetical protein
LVTTSWAAAGPAVNAPIIEAAMLKAILFISVSIQMMNGSRGTG